MILRFVTSEGDAQIYDANDHPIFESPFVKSVLECHNDEEEADNLKIVSIRMPTSFSRDSVLEFCNLLHNFAAGSTQMGFGKYYEYSFREVYSRHVSYYYWAIQQDDPSPKLKAWLDWVEFYRSGSKPESLEKMLPIAKYFQIDMCAGCGVLGFTEGMEDIETADTSELHPCRRTGWPRLPIVPDWQTVTKDEKKDKLKAWREAWERAEKTRSENGRIVCCSNDQFCEDCIEKNLGCQRCKNYECGDCQKDDETPKVFQEWHEGLPDADYEDEYGRRGNCPYRAMKTSRCLKCGRRICQDCGQECQDCHRRACDACKEDLNTWCAGCRGTIENNDDNAIGPIDRDEYVCRECFDLRPQFCGCGEPSYDPDASDTEEGGSDASEDEDSDPDASNTEEGGSDDSEDENSDSDSIGS